MDVPFDQAIAAALIFSPFVFAIVEVIKRAGLVDKYAGLVSIAVGIVVAFVGGEAVQIGEVDASYWQRTLMTGIAAGLIASGAYSATKAATQGPTTTG